VCRQAVAVQDRFCSDLLLILLTQKNKKKTVMITV
jgi:predicted nucleic acid-binding Zn ribbon protein